MKAHIQEAIDYLYNRYTYEEIDLIEEAICKIQTVEWKKRQLKSNDC